MDRISICIPYFGAWPRWMPFFLETCRRNSTIQWLFFTDIPAPIPSPPNVRFIPMSLLEVRKLASEQLGFDVVLGYPFKLCDFRPAFGQIFSAWLADCEYWGWGDLDVFYGDIRRFLTARRLGRFDVISPRYRFLAGEFTLLRNSELINRLYTESADYRGVLTSERCWNFCEKGFFKDRTVDSMTQVVQRAALGGRVKVLYEDMLLHDRKMLGRPLNVLWRDGRLFDLNFGQEHLLYHFLDRKGRSDFVFPDVPASLPFGFVVQESGVSIPEKQIAVVPSLVHQARSHLIRLYRSIRDRLRDTAPLAPAHRPDTAASVPSSDDSTQTH